MQWSLRSLLNSIAVVAIGLLIYQLYWGEKSQPTYFNSRVIVAAYLAALVVTSLSAWYRHAGQRFWIGYSVFGWCYFIFMLRTGTGFSGFMPENYLLKSSPLGFLMSLATGIAFWILSDMNKPPSRNEAENHQNSGREES